MFRTPKKAEGDMQEKQGKPPLRSSFGKSEVAVPGAAPASPGTSTPLPKNKTFTLPQKPRVARSPSQSGGSSGTTSPKKQDTDRVKEAMDCLMRGKKSIELSRNTKNEIREEVKRALERLAQLVREADAELFEIKQGKDKNKPEPQPTVSSSVSLATVESGISKVLEKLEQHTQLLLENGNALVELKDHAEKQLANGPTTAERPTYAEVTGMGATSAVKRETLHSIIVTSVDETESSEEVLRKVRLAVDAKDGWVHVEKVRKAKKQKLIVGVRSKEERQKLKERLKERAADLKIEEVTNKDPLLVLRDVLNIHSDDDILGALRRQNGELFDGLDLSAASVAVKYRRKARNPLTSHVVLSVPPGIWQRATKRGFAYIDMQRVRAEDQSPLVQCSRCLGYGHGKRFCREEEDWCCHCEGNHLRHQCADYHEGIPPTCRNCRNAGLLGFNHNAFSEECPIRKKWESLARSTISYC